MNRKINPLHQAVIEGDEAAISSALDNPQWRKEHDPLGFTPLELAQLLGRKNCQSLLGGILPKAIKVQKKDESRSAVLPIKAFERDFGLTYHPFLTFPSYANLNKTIHDCPYLLRCRWLTKENHDLAAQYQQQLASGATVPVCVKWINDSLEYGLFADVDIPAGTYVGEYAGQVRRLFRKHPDHNAYCFHYPSRFWSLRYYVIDARWEGNLMRFLNHSDHPNIRPLCLVDRGILHLAFVTSQSIAKGSQLTFDYGNDYWITRTKLEN